jgi:hypothetical protein
MKLENQVVSLELAKRLKELGVKQESLFWWVDYTDGYSEPAWNLNSNHVGYKAHLSAYTVAELGEMLPGDIGRDWWLDIWKSDDFWYVAYTEEREGGGHDFLSDFLASSPTEADARAKMLIYLIENNLITL